MLYLALNQTILIGIACVNFLIGLYVLLRDPKNPVHASFFLFVSGIAIWTGGFGMLSLFASLLADKIVHYGGLMMLLGFVLFSRVFPQGAHVSRLTIVPFIPILLAAIFIIPSNLLVQDIIQHADGRIEPVVGPLLVWYAVGYLCYTAWGFINLARTYARSSEHPRLQITYLSLGIGILLVSLLVADLFLPALFGITELNLLGPLASLVFVLLTSYAIVRHQLMDIRIVIQRGILYSILLGLIIGFYVCLIQTLRFLLPMNGDVATFGAAILTTVLGIFTAAPIERAFRKVTDRIFFKDTYNYASAMHTLSEVLYANVEFQDLVRESEKALSSILRASSVRIVLDPQATLAEREKELQIPIRIEGTAIGCIYLGPKRSGDAYSLQDMQLLQTFAYQAATAFSRAQLYAKEQEHAAELERKVAERTRELSETHERERQMLNDLSHNLQTPLTILQTKLDRLKPLIKEDERVRTFELALSGFSGFIYDLMALARLEGGRAGERIPVGLSDLISELAEEIGVIAASSDIRVKTTVAPDLWVIGDPRSLREALLNVASNALKFMREKGPREIFLNAAPDADKAVVTIRDTGIGIMAEDLPHIFDRFYQARNRTSQNQGTGLGLSIAKRIVEQHAGTITVMSTYGEGTSITIHLPRTKERS